MDTEPQTSESFSKILIMTPLDPQRLSRWFAGTACAVAILGLASWAFSLPRLSSLLVGKPTMGMNTAFGLLGGGLALLLHGIPSRSRSARMAALVPTILGGLTTLQYLSGQDWGLHHALTPGFFPSMAFGPGNTMAPNAALGLAFLGSALLNYDPDRKGTTWPDILVLSTFFMTLLAILGYLFEVRLLYGVAEYKGMAISACIGLLALCMGTLILRKDFNFLAVLRLSGVSGKIVWRILTLTIGIPLVLTWLHFQSKRFVIFESTFTGVVVSILPSAWLTSLVLWGTHMLSDLDKRRALAEAKLRELNQSLELNITKRTGELLESEDRFRQLAAHSDYLFWFFEVNPGRVVFVNSAFKRIFGLPAERIYRDPDIWIAAAHPEDQQRIRMAWEACLSGQFPGIEEEFRIIQPDGSIRWLLNSGTAIRNEAGEIIRIGSVARDITERKRVEIELSRVNREIQAINICQQTLMRTVDEQTLLNDICQIICEVAGYRLAWVGFPEDDDAKTIRPVAWAGVDDGYITQARLTWADTERGQGPGGKAIRSGEWSYVPSFETLLQMAPWCESALQHGLRSLISLPLKDENATVFGVLNIYSAEVNAISPNEIRLLEGLSGDLAFGIITLRTRIARQQAEESLRQSRESYASLFEHVSLGLYRTSIEGQIMMANQAFCTMFGYASFEDMAQCDFGNNPTYSRSRFQDELEEKSRVTGLESIWTRPNGETVILRESARSIYDGSGNLIYFEGIVEDISEYKRAEAEILKLNRELEDKVMARTSDLERVNRALTIKEEEIHSVVDHIADCVITMDENSLIRSANPAVEKIFGYVADEIIGRNVSLLLPEPHRAAHDGYIERYCSTGQARIIGIGREVEGIHKNGESISLDLAISQYSIQGQRFFTGILRDIRERVRIMADLEQARREAEQANQAKSAFLAAMSHEIRTPLNGVIGMVDVLHQTSLMGYQVEMVDLIRESAFSLLTIIEDILDFSKIEAGRLEIEQEPMLLPDVIERSCGMMDPFAEKKGVKLTLFIDPMIPEAILGDALRLRQVLVNLLSNAIKFSSGQPRAGLVSMRALLLGQRPDEVRVKFTVADNGIGMDEATQMRLFMPFNQADVSTTRRFGGTGLGLAISRHLVNLMGGEIEVQSAPDKGSTFSVSLPFVPVPALADPGETASPIDGLSCMVVGGPEGQAKDLAVYLWSAGAVIEQAPDLKTAGERAGTLSSGLWVWVIDEGNEQTSSEDLRAALCKRPDIECRFVIIERGQNHRRRQPRLEGADLVIVDGNLLTRKNIVKAVAIAAGRAKEDRGTPLPGRHKTTISIPSRAEAIRHDRLILIAEDNETNQKVILQQLAILGFVGDLACDGHQALKRWRTGDYALLLTDLHMPNMDGYELAAAVRTEEKGSRHRPIIALTANALKGEAERCRAMGMDDYLTKPTPLVELQTILERWLPASGPCLDLQATPAPLARVVGPVDLSVLKALVGDDPAVIQELLHVFWVSAAKTAAELKAASKNGQAAQTEALAHKLKSSARAVGALSLGELCAEMEQVGKAGKTEALTGLWLRFEAEIAAVYEYLHSL